MGGDLLALFRPSQKVEVLLKYFLARQVAEACDALQCFLSICGGKQFTKVLPKSTIICLALLTLQSIL